jgi:hypothetical protein
MEPVSQHQSSGYSSYRVHQPHVVNETSTEGRRNSHDQTGSLPAYNAEGETQYYLYDLWSQSMNSVESGLAEEQQSASASDTTARAGCSQ